MDREEEDWPAASSSGLTVYLKPASEGLNSESSLTAFLWEIPLPALMCTRSLIRTASKYVSSEPMWHAAEEHLNQIDFTDLNYEDTDIMHKVIYPSEEFK